MRNSIKNFLASVAIVTIIIYNIDFGTDSVSVGEDDIQSEEGNLADVSSLPSARFHRATPDEILKDSVEKMQVIARLSNVIYLQQGLSKGTTLETEKLIQELLHFGSVTTGIIASLDLHKIEAALTLIKELPPKPQTGDKIEELEKAFDLIGEILMKMEGMKQYSKWENKNDYIADLETIKNGNTNFGIASNLTNDLSSWKLYYSNVIKLTAPFKMKNFGTFESLSTTAKSLMNATAVLTKSVPLLVKFKDATSAIDAIKILIRNHESFQILQSKGVVTTDDYFEKFEANIRLTADSFTQINEINSSLTHIKSLYFSRLNPATTTSSEYTSGLPNGYDDVVKLSQAFNDNEWLKRLIKNDSLSKSYPSVQSLGISLNSIQKHLGPTDQTQFEVLAEILEYAKRLGSFSNFPLEDAKTVAKSVSEVPVAPVEKTESVKKLESDAKKIGEEHGKLRKELKAISKVLAKQEKNFNAIVNKIGEADDNYEESVSTMITDLLKLNELKELNGVLEKIDLRNLTEDTLKGLADNSLTLLKDVDAYQTSAQTLSSYLNSLLAAKDAPKVVGAFKNFKLLRLNSKDKKKYDNGLKYVQGVVNTKNDLGSLKKAIEAAKGTTTLESGSLNLFQQSDIHTDIIGLSTRAIVNMKSLLDKKSDFDVIKTNSKLVKDEMNKNSKKFNQTETNSLNSLTTLDTSLDKMFIELNTWKDDVSKLQFTSLKSYSKIFAEAKKVNPLSVDLGEMSLAIEKLIESVQDQKSNQPLQQVKFAVDTLNGLQFSKYSKNFDSMEDSLVAMNMFFANYLSDILVKLTPKAPLKKKKIVQGPSSSNGSNGPNAVETKNNSWIWICVAAFFIIVIIIIIVVACVCRKKKKNLKKFDPVVPPFMKGLHYAKALRLQYKAFQTQVSTDFIPNGQEKTIENSDILKFCHFLFTSANSETKEEVSDLVKKHLDETNVPLHLCELNRVRVPTEENEPIHFLTDYLHANLIKLRNLWNTIVMQGAVEKTKDKIWYVIRKMQSPAIVSLCNISESNVIQCQQFYGSAKGDVHSFGEYTVKCTERTDKGDVITRKQELSIKGEHIMDIDHYQHTDWPAGESGPRDPQSVIKLLKKVRKLDKPVIVHCNDGAGRSGTFMYIEQIYQEIYFSKNGQVDHGRLLRELREQRSGSVQSSTQLAFAILANLEMTVGDAKVETGEVHREGDGDAITKKKNNKNKNKFIEADRDFLNSFREAWALVRPPKQEKQ